MTDDLPKKVTKEAEEKARFDHQIAAERRKVLKVITKGQKLLDNLRGDLQKHGESERWKRYGDLLLANIHNAERRADSIFVTDYFDEAVPVIEIEGESNKSINEIAENYFRRYTKARNGLRVIGERMATAETEVEIAEKQLRKIDAAVETGDTEFLSSLIEPVRKPVMLGRKKKIEAAFKGARRFMSSDGFEILVGKKAKDNDYLTFRVAKSLDLWLHAADYPGSHVVVRIPNRKDLPNQTLIEAAQLAAFYSDAREKPKAAVNYTQKKFVNKPKRAAPGLVSLSAFKTILIEPQVPSSVTLV
ncbi:MAG: NFACT RNA binding domain-containing protein [Pyrinomonadaceae bacterium]